MPRFTQLHYLTPYHPSNLNRDDLGRPKTAIFGGVQRLRVSSQSLKRAWRCSDLFAQAFSGHLGTRTKEQGKKVYEALRAKGIEEKKAKDWAAKIAAVFGKAKAKEPLEIEQLAHLSPEEEAAIQALVERLAGRDAGPTDDDLNLLRRSDRAVDIAMFGRMLASSPAYNVEAAVQVAHALTVHQTPVEDDFFTAVDDLNQGLEDMGAGHMGETEFGAGVFYLYVCVDNALLIENLQAERSLAGRALRALTEVAATVAPTGKQNSFASRSYAQYLLAERGDRQPRSLACAFLKPVPGPGPSGSGPDQLTAAIKALEEARTKMDQAYGPLAEEFKALSVPEGRGSLAEILDFVGRGL